ncbi:MULTISPECIES: PTS sugar transporter subunit IIC [Aeromonas]|uniref:Permease IIC component n=2 Tax=Aeromonas caviae TaxID=648 RepID=A0AA37CVH6_AERCA|nr:MULTISPECIES: PTS transporter subunit EIIC [Aeromonas]MBP4060458.1 PTS sugar transporter subunit IIC [Aeromonas sp. Prich7-2]MDU7778508.1 PTS transporter subunit EIIC [Aeromonas caviae]MDX7595302.1 PTS transporter subunit EIIC [Aeromonas caviae]MDX7803772.1 PTS transporter subunit EIIC [Aeromonas caviae]MDY7798265.1 PTS transporter subunit EIIC [Aeromonas caviae]
MNMQVMGMLASIVEQRMIPVANWLTRSRHVMALRDGFQLAMPFIIVGSLLVPILYPPVASDNAHPLAIALRDLSQQLMPWLYPVYSHTAGLVSLIIAFGAAASLAKAYEMPERLSGLCGCVAFLLLIDFRSAQGGVFGYLGGLGIFTALLAAFYTVEVIRLFQRAGWIIQFPEEVPLMTRQGFQLIIPLLFITLSLSLLRLWLQQNFGISLPELMEYLFQPLVTGADTLPALLIALLVAHLLWFMGVHGALIVNGLLSPFWMAGLSANQGALMAGEPLPHIFLQGFWDYYLLIGGIGTTLPLVFMAMRSRSRTLHSVGRLGLIPSLFNINEPLLFGFPIIMNPLFFLPFIGVPMVNATLAWLLTEWGYLDRFVAMLPWSMPSPLGAAWAANGSLANALMVLVCILNSYVLYRPFFIAHERMLLAQETERRAH